MKRFGLVIPMLLASCGTLPEPFFGDPGLEGARLIAPPAPVLVVPTPSRAMLANAAAVAYADDLAAALNAIDIPSVARPAGRADWMLSTTASAAGASVIPAYAIAGPGGKIYGTQTGAPVPAASWAQGDAAALLKAANQDALTLSKKLAEINAQVQQSNPDSLENRPPRVFMGAVTGAPGDGDNALTLNMTRDLPSPQNQLVRNAAMADFTVTGFVKAQPDAHNQLLVELDWIVTDSENRKIGQVTQLHDLDPADVEPVWGDVAAAAAAEAASGVNEVIANATLHKAGQDFAVSSGPLAGGMALAIPPVFGLPAPDLAGARFAAAFAPPAPGGAEPAPVEVASITEPLPMPITPVAAAPIAPVPAAIALAKTAPAVAAPAAAAAVPQPKPATAPAAAVELAALRAPQAPAPFAASPFRVAANAVGSLFDRIAGVFSQPAAPEPIAVPPREVEVAFASPRTAQPLPQAQPEAPAEIQPTEADFVQPAETTETGATAATAATQPAIVVQPVVFITPVQAAPLAPLASPDLTAEYGATALITPVVAVPLSAAPARQHVAARLANRVAVMRGRFDRPVPARDLTAPATPQPATPQPAEATPTLPALVAISDSQLWRVAVPIPVTFAPTASMFRHLVYMVPERSRAPARPFIHAVFRAHIHPAAPQPVLPPAHPMTVPAPAVIAAVAAPAAAPTITPPPVPAGPIESSYDVLER